MILSAKGDYRILRAHMKNIVSSKWVSEFHFGMVLYEID